MGPAALIPVMVSRSVSPPLLVTVMGSTSRLATCPSHYTSTHVQSPTRFFQRPGHPSHVHCCLPGLDENKATACLALILTAPTSAPSNTVSTAGSIGTSTSTAHSTTTGISPKYALVFPAWVPSTELLPSPGSTLQTPPGVQGTVRGLRGHPRITRAKGIRPPASSPRFRALRGGDEVKLFQSAPGAWRG